jgi:limonene-1,2-epoxide hydrolase
VAIREEKAPLLVQSGGSNESGSLSSVGPAETVAAAFKAVREDDLDAAVALFSEDCAIALPGETYEGHDGVRAWRAKRESGTGPQLSAGEPEAVDSTHVLVPLMVEVAIGGMKDTVKATGIWTVVDGLITEVRAVPGGRRMALASLEAD